DLAAQQANVNNLEKSLASTQANRPDNPARPASADVVQKYQSLANRLTQLQQAETELLSRYTAENRLVKGKQAQIADLEKQRRDLEKKNPGLLDIVPVAISSQGVQGSRLDLPSERARLAGLESRVEALKSRVSGLHERAKLISELGPRIEELDRKRAVE